MQTSADALVEELERYFTVRREVPASRLTTFGLGGALQLVAEPQSILQLIDGYRFLKQEGIGMRILGSGSNLIIPDEGVSDLVLHLGKPLSGSFFLSTSGITLDSVIENFAQNRPVPVSNSLFVYGGTALMPLSRKVSQLGRAGLEFAAGIPGSMGGALWMNAGAHGEDISQVIKSAFVILPDGTFRTFSKAEIGFSYRCTTIPAGSLVVGVELELWEEDPEVLLRRREECLNYRKVTQPLHLPSAGSVFRNPSQSTGSNSTTLPAAAVLLESVGLKGLRHGGVMFSELHANWLVRVAPDAKAVDAQVLIALAKKRVQEEYAVVLHSEIELW